MFTHRFVEIKNMVIVEPIKHLPTTFPVAHQSGISQSPQLMRHGRLRYREAFRKVTDATFRIRKQRDQTEASRIGQDSEELSHPLRVFYFQRKDPFRRFA